MTTLGSQSNILKEVYERGKKMPDGMTDDAKKMMPPFMKGRKVANVEDAKKAKGDAARRRLAMMRKNSGK